MNNNIMTKFGLIFTFLFFMGNYSPALSQSLLKTWESNDLETIYIQRISSSRVIYRMDNDKSSPKIKIDLNEIQEILNYKNDTLFFLNGERIPISPDAMFLQSRSDALENYPGSKAAEVGVLAITSIQPIFGILTATLVTMELPKEVNLNYPDSVLMEDNSYKIGYVDQATKKKEKRVMNRLLIGIAVNLAVTAAILLN